MKRAGFGIGVVIAVCLLFSANAGAQTKDSYVGSRVEAKSVSAQAPSEAKVLSSAAEAPRSLAFTGGDVAGMALIAVVAIGVGVVTLRFRSVRSARA